ncbi:MAG: hypothetical protein EHM41_25675 [Chloroflexi bacterium]|nr:MAG: hypothetical protein EHM41_25675 [Chloroflexota bacterium]
MNWFVAFIIFITCLILMVGAAIVRSRLIRRKLKLKITNQGNIDTRYYLRADAPAGSLDFRFSLNGRELPMQMITDPAARYTSAPAQYQPTETESRKKPNTGNILNKGISSGSAFASLLTSIGTMLPRGMGEPFLKAGSKVYQGQMRAGYAQQVSTRASYFVPQKDKKAAQQAPVQVQTEIETTIPGERWYEVPTIRPGEHLDVDLTIRSTGEQQSNLVFQVFSKPTEAGCGPEVVEKSTVYFRGGFWSHKFWPQITILSIALVLFLFTFLLHRAGVLV